MSVHVLQHPGLRHRVGDDDRHPRGHDCLRIDVLENAVCIRYRVECVNCHEAV